MSIAQHVHRRGGIYHLRCRVPLDLLSIIGRVEIRRSLATACPKQAKRRATVLYGRLLAIFEKLRMSPEERERHLAELLSLSVERKNEVIVELVSMTEQLEDELSLTAADGEYHRSQYEALERVTSENEQVLSENLTMLLSEMQRLIKSEKLGGAAAALETVRGMLGDMGLPVRTTETPKVSKFLADTYLTEKRLQDDSSRHIINFITLFARITGDKPLAQYTRTDVVNYVRVLEQLSSSTGKSPKDKDASIEELLAKSRDKPTMGATTIEKHVQHVKAFFNAARKHIRFANGEDINEMFDDIDLSEFVPQPQKRKHWPIERLNRLFDTPIWTGTGSGSRDFSKRDKEGTAIYRDAYWWLPVAALWTGARLEELAQLHHEDLKRDKNDIPFICIHDEGIRRVKTASSIRDVPVHSALVQFGFLDLFDPTKAGQRIWPELLPTGRMRKFGDTYSSHFTDYRRRCNLYERLMDFHSLRRTFITCMRTRAKVDAMTVAAMAGHDEDLPIFERAKQTDDYTDYDIAPLAAEVEKLDFVGYGMKVNVFQPVAETGG